MVVPFLRRQLGFGIGRKALSNMCDFFFVQDNASGHEKRCVLAVVFAAVGRGGEIAFTK